VSNDWFRPLSEDVTVPTLPQIRIEEHFLERSPTTDLPRRIPQVHIPVEEIEYPEPKPVPNPEDVAEIEDQILRLAFGKAVKTIRRRTFAMVFFTGIAVGFIALLVALIVLLDKAGAP
jgi:hypothetical protein